MRRLIVASFLVLLPWVARPVAPAVAKSFTFGRVAIEAVVSREGDLAVTEARTYRFDGDFSWATYRLPLVGASRIRDIRIADERGPLRRAGTAGPGTYQVSRDGDAVVIRWGLAASNESRTFVISYVLDDVVTVYDDIAELYWKFIGSGWDRPSEDVAITVRLPDGLRPDQIRVWGHGPLHGEARPAPGGAVLTVQNLPAFSMVEARVVFPKEAVPLARRRLAEVALPRILREEGVWARQANRRRTMQRLLFGSLAGLPVLTLGLWAFLYLRFGREPRPRGMEGYYRELPGSYPPAVLGALWRFGSVQPADFAATVLDLVRRGYLSVETEAAGRSESYTLIRTAKTEGLHPFEADALAMLFGRPHAEGQRVTIDRRTGPPAETRRRIGEQFSRWAAKVSKDASARGFFDPASMTLSTVCLVAGILLMILGGAVAAGVQAILGIAAALSGLVLAAGSGAVRRRSQPGADDLLRWQGFRQFLLDFSEMPRAGLPSLAIWEHYLVYAVPLGVADRVIRQLRSLYPAEELAASPGLRSWAGASSARGADPLASLGAFTTALAAATSSASSGSGRGGGFSGGGGGGGGGSGGSAG
ncbi:MAG: DUF2207 domain-containing protein [Armatimonadota bacterium]|nr:DUF2207 domain-containing protein [Armatimonadota bacterium]